MKKTLVLLLTLLFMMEAYAQKSNLIIGDCGTPVPQVDVLKLKGNKYQPYRIAAASQLFRIYVHILRNSDGSNAACNISQIENEIRDFMNPDYGGASTCFAIVGFQYINNTHLNTACNVDSAADKQAIEANNKNDCINIYCHRSGLKAYKTMVPLVYSGLNGSAYSIPSNFVSINIGNNILSGVRTLAHETGHALGLYHTFERYFGDELVNGNSTNRKTTGDLITDTQADPYPDKYATSPEVSFAPNCVFTGTGLDANNDLYNPPVQNTMSYYHHFSANGCQRNMLTAAQFVRIDSVTGVTTSLLNSIAPNSLLLTNTTLTTGEQRTAALSYIIVGQTFGTAYTLSGTHTAFIKSARISLTPGSFIQPGAGGVVSFMTTTCQ